MNKIKQWISGKPVEQDFLYCIYTNKNNKYKIAGWHGVVPLFNTRKLAQEYMDDLFMEVEYEFRKVEINEV